MVVYFDKLYCPQRKTTDDIQDIPEEFRFIIELTCGTEKHKKYWKKCFQMYNDMIERE